MDSEVGGQFHQQQNHYSVPARLQYPRLSHAHRHPPRLTTVTNPLPLISYQPCRGLKPPNPPNFWDRLRQRRERTGLQQIYSGKLQNAANSPRMLPRVGQEASGTFCSREVYRYALHQGENTAQQILPPHSAYLYDLPQLLYAYSGCDSQQETQLAAPHETHQVKARHPDQCPHQAYGLNMGRLPTGLEAALHCYCTLGHHHWLPCMVNTP